MLLALLFGCGPGQIETDEGPEPLRTALYFAPDSTLSVALRGTRQAYLLLANSTVPCRPEEVEDNPATDTDETLAAADYWEAQFATAFAREGARVVVLMLSVGAEEDWLGTYTLRAEAWDPTAAAERVAEDGRVAAGGWYHVQEAAVEDASGVVYADGIEVVEEEHDLAVDDPASVVVEEKHTVLGGTFDFPGASLSGSFQAERCENTDLLSDLWQALYTLALELPE